MATAIRQELLQYRLYLHTTLGQVWTNPERADLSLIDQDVEIADFVDLGSEIRPWGDYSHLRGLMFSVSLTECIVLDGPAFRYDRTEPNARGVVNCSGKCC
jgi:hypothetical protein